MSNYRDRIIQDKKLSQRLGKCTINVNNNNINEDPLRVVLRINQSMNYIEKINDLKETYAQAGVTEIIVDINWDNENSIDNASKILFS